MKLYHTSRLALAALATSALACAGSDLVDQTTDNEDNAFLSAEQFAEEANDGKEDTGYITSLDGREAELTIEAEVEATSYARDRAPLEVGQFALTWFRQNSDLYIQSLAEDYADGEKQVEWLVGTAWKSWGTMTQAERDAAKRFRLTRVNAVFLHASSKGLANGKVFEATVPLNPGTLMSDVGNACAEEGHITASSSVYWYVWAPEKAGCKAKLQKAKATITNLLPKGKTVYPEYDKLWADKKLDIVVFWGQVEDNYSESDYGFYLTRRFETSLTTAGFKKVAAPKGLRYERTKKGFTTNVTIFSPREFKGLGDYANVQSFYDAVNANEVIVWNGHSMLGGSDFWASPQIYKDPSKYQIFLYNGCLGYEYYVKPILDGKKLAANVDLVSNVIETPFAIMNQITSTAVAMLSASPEKGGVSTWQSILTKMNAIGGEDSFYGTSAARDNVYKPKK